MRFYNNQPHQSVSKFSFLFHSSTVFLKIKFKKKFDEKIVELFWRKNWLVTILFFTSG